MTRPVLLTVDDEPQVLGAIRRDLVRRYGGEYRIVAAGSGAEAIATLDELRRRDAAVALVLADQRMPGITGVEVLEKVRELHPDARKALLTAYADTEAAIRSINTVGLDHYLLKPWDPPDQNLYPVIDELLEDWKATVPPPWDGVRVLGTQWSAPSHAIKDFLARNRVPYRWIDVDGDPEARRRIEELGASPAQLPVVLLADGQALIQPDRVTLAARLGMRTVAAQPFYDLVVVGGGPAGLGAAVYAASEGLSTVLVEREATGGQAGTSSRIENYLGFPSGIAGADLATRATTQAGRFGAEIVIPQEAVKIEVEAPYKHVTLADGTRLSCYALLLATGMEVRRLDVPGADRLTGSGVYYGAALTEAANYRGKHVFVVGAANSAGQGAMFFARYAERVTILSRRNLAISMSSYLIDQINATPNIEVWTESVVVEAKGDDRLDSLVIARGDRHEEVPAAAVFVFIGQAPRTALLEGVVARDAQGFVLTGNDVPAEVRVPGFDPTLLETSVPGIFAAGDARHGSQKRVAAAVGEGAVAVALIHGHLAKV